MTVPPETALVALDWGTSSLRALRLGGGGAVLEARRSPAGIQRLRPEATAGPADFARAFTAACGDWLARSPGTPVLACGMVGSAHGWREAPYLELPADPEALARALVTVEAPGGATVWIVPGLRSPGELPGVLRGEETQVAGLMGQLPAGECLVGLPGSHSKWMRVAGGRMMGFDTFMTGEVFAALSEHTILSRTLRPAAGLDSHAFDRGLSVARSEPGRAGLLSTAFTVRALALAGRLPGEAQADYLSGLLIGHELRGLEEHRPGLLAAAARVVLAGDPGLCERYRRALAAAGLPPPMVVEDAAERGLWRIAVTAGLVPAGTAQREQAVAPRAATARDGLEEALRECGLVAILRGVRPAEAVEIGAVLSAAGFRILEVPLNSPDPLESVRRLRAALPGCVVGVGTVLAPDQVEEACAAGAQLVVMPHADPSVIRAARGRGLPVVPGVATPGEAFAALSAGATALKLFPAEVLPPAVVRAWRAVLPPGTRLLPVGGIGPESLAPYLAAGASGFGIGSALYRPGATAAEVGARAAELVRAWRAAAANREGRPPAGEEPT
jgi:2-dehydro-3-deoxygalactonokinase